MTSGPPQVPGLSKDELAHLFAIPETPGPMKPMPPVPTDIDNWLPLARDAAISPGAPQQLRDFVNYVAAQVGPA